MDKVKIREYIEKTIELYKIYLDCKEKISNEKVVDFPKMFDNYVEITEKCGDKRKAFWDFLSSLSEEEVIQIFSIMYAGRDYVLSIPEEPEFVPFEEQYKYFKGERKEIAISMMFGKSPLIDYLQAGMKYYSI